MLLLLAAVVLQAAPVDVVVTQHGGTRWLQALRAQPDRTVVDASELYGHLIGSDNGLLDFQDFNAFQEAPVADWPASLKAVWVDSVAYCRDIAGPSPWKATLPGARCCARRLGRYLWQRYLAEQHAVRVFVFDFRAESQTTITATLSGLDDADELMVTRTVPQARAETVSTELLKELLAGRGVKQARLRVPVLFTPLEADPWRAVGQATPPPKPSPTCAQAPSKLTVSTQGALANALSTRWTVAKGEGAALTCTLRFSVHQELEALSGLDPTVVSSVLTCGERTLTQELLKAAPGDSTARVADGLVSALAAEMCRAK